MCLPVVDQFDVTDDSSGVTAPGRKWQEIGKKKPDGGRELVNEDLTLALLGDPNSKPKKRPKTTFSDADLEAMGLKVTFPFACTCARSYFVELPYMVHAHVRACHGDAENAHARIFFHVCVHTSHSAHSARPHVSACA